MARYGNADNNAFCVKTQTNKEKKNITIGCMEVKRERERESERNTNQ